MVTWTVRALALCLCALAVIQTSGRSTTASEGRKVTGYRMIRDQRDFDIYVIREALPTVLLVHSSNDADCDPAQAVCSELMEDFKQAAAETKGYIRFASIDAGTPEGKELAQSSLRMGENDKPPSMFAFSERADYRGARPAMRLNTQNRVPVSYLKKIAGDMLPANVHRSKTVADFDTLYNTSVSNSVPFVVVLAPKLSEKPTAMLKAAWAQLIGLANFTTVDYSAAEGKLIADRWTSIVGDALAKNETVVVGIDAEGIKHKSADPAVSPDSILELASTLASTFRKKSSGNTSSSSSAKKKTPPVPPGVYSNFTEEDYAGLVLRPNTATVFALRLAGSNETFPSPDPKSNLSWPSMATHLFGQFGIHSAIIWCDNAVAPPKLCLSNSAAGESPWLFYVSPARRSDQKKERTIQRAASIQEASDKAKKSVLDAESEAEDGVEIIDATGASEMLSIIMGQWYNPSLKESARLPLFYLALDDEIPPFIRAVHASTREVAKIVFVRPGASDDAIRALHLDPAQTFPPQLIAYVPTFDAPVDKEDEDKKKKKKGKGQQEQPPKTKIAYRVVPFESQKQSYGGTLQYETGVLFVQDLLRFVSPEKWEKYMDETFALVVPPALSNPFLTRLGKSSRGGSSASQTVPPTEYVSNGDTLSKACEGNGLCVVAFGEKREDKARFDVLETTRKQLEKTAFGSGLKFVLIDGSCHTQVVEVLGGDASMLPVVSVYSPTKRSYAVMRGAFTSDNIQSLIRSVKKGAVGVQPISGTKNPSELFSDESVCYASAAAEGEADEDEMLRELREEAQREEQRREEERKQAETEGKRLKEEREKELKKKREEMNKKAEDERLARRKAQMELDEQRLKEREKAAKEKAAKKAQEEKSTKADQL